MEKANGVPKTDKERLKAHFGDDWKNHDVTELPARGTGGRRNANKKVTKTENKNFWNGVL